MLNKAQEGGNGGIGGAGGAGGVAGNGGTNEVEHPGGHNWSDALTAVDANGGHGGNANGGNCLQQQMRR